MQDGEFIAAKARDAVGVTCFGEQPFANLHEQGRVETFEARLAGFRRRTRQSRRTCVRLLPSRPMPIRRHLHLLAVLAAVSFLGKGMTDKFNTEGSQLSSAGG